MPKQPIPMPVEGLFLNPPWWSEILWAPGSNLSKIWEVRSCQCLFRGLLGIIATGRNEAGVHLMMGCVEVIDCFQVADLKQLNENRTYTGLPQYSALPYPATWAIVCANPVLYDIPVSILTKAQKFVRVQADPRANIVKHMGDIIRALPFGQTHQLQLHLSFICRPVPALPKNCHGSACQRVLRYSGVWGGRVFVAVSSVAEKCLGLFMRRNCQAGDVVDSYGGALVAFKNVQLPASHTRTIIRGRWVLDGRVWSSYFRQSEPGCPYPEAFFVQQSALPVEERRPLLPVSGCPLRDTVVTVTGAGYMANTSAERTKINVRISEVRHHREGDVTLPYESVFVLIATKPLAKYEEVFSKYTAGLDEYRKLHNF